MPWYIADRMGFFDELNIDVEYESFIGGPAMMEASASWDICDVGAPGILNGIVGILLLLLLIPLCRGFVKEEAGHEQH